MQAYMDKRGGRKNLETFDKRTDRLMYFGMWCLVLTLAFVVVTRVVFNTAENLKCSADGEHFVFEDCDFSALVHFI